MTWHTQNGDRFLVGREAELFIASVRMALEALDDNTLLTEETVFVDTDRTLIIRFFAYVAQALLEPTDVMPELNAWTEGAVGILLREFAVSLEAELDKDDVGAPDRYLLRQLLIDATASELEEEDRVPLECKDIGEWQALLAFQADAILWDLDWEMTELFPPDTPGGYFAKFEPPISYSEAILTLERIRSFREEPLRLFNPELN